MSFPFDSDLPRRAPGKGYAWEAPPVVEASEGIARGWDALMTKDDGRVIEAGQARFDFSGEGLVSAVHVAGEPLLRAPIELSLEAGGRRHSLNDIEPVSDATTDAFVEFVSRSSVEGLDVRLSLRLEYDGFLLISLVLEPGPEGSAVDRLSLELPLAAAAGRVLNRHVSYDDLTQRPDRASVLSNVEIVDGVSRHGFSPVVSVESDEYGIEWMTETDAYHRLENSDEAIVATVNQVGGVDLRIDFVDRPVPFSEPIAYQFSLFPVPSRPSSDRRPDRLIASAPSAEAFARRYGRYRELSPLYFAHWARLPFEHVGLPVLSSRERDVEHIEKELSALRDVGAGYMPYGSLHLMDSTVDELSDYRDTWAASSTREGFWRGLDDDKVGVQPVSHDDPSLADFMIAQHLVALDQELVAGLYHDVAGMNRLDATLARARRQNALLSEATLYMPFFGLRSYVQRYRTAIKKRSPDTAIVFHTGSMLPKSIATYADTVVFGESFHFAFAEMGGKRPGPDYAPDYFALPSALFAGPLSQKNGFDYMLIPQLVRGRGGVRPEADVLDAQTRQMLAFAFLHDYPVWGTKLSGREHAKYLRVLDRFGRSGGNHFFARQHLAAGRVRRRGRPGSGRSRRRARRTGDAVQ